MTRVVKPVRFQPALLTSTTATNAETAWTPGSYALGVVKLHTVTLTTGVQAGMQQLRRFESLVAANTFTPGTDATKWQNIGPANTVAMFDAKISTQTTSAGPLTVVLSPGAMVTTVGAMNLVGSTITLTVKDGAVVTYTETRNLVANNVTDWFEYFTAPFEQLTRVVFDNLPCYPSSTLTLTLTGTTTAIGHLVFGQSYEIGSSPEYGATSGILDYSTKETDLEFGDTELVERDYADESSFSVDVEKPRLNAVTRLLTSLRATPCLVIASDDIDYAESLVIFCWFRSWQKVIDRPTKTTLDIELEGLT